LGASLSYDGTSFASILLLRCGGVGTGKSKVLSYLELHYSCKILQADVVANVLKQQGEDGYEPTISLLGNSILNKDGSINNRKMGELIFSSPTILEKVNKIIHPLVKNRIVAMCEEEKKKAKIDFLFIEAALLVEAGYQDIVDEMWYVYADDIIRRKRLKEYRGYTDKKINEIFASQISKKEFEKACDFLINNSGLWEKTEIQIIKKMEGYSWKKK
jgi:dephospho-CoA kinase